MAKDQLRDFHIFALESVLPFGMGIIKVAKKGGLKKIRDVLKSKDAFLELQVDGDTSAKKVRDKIDKFFPGLGYPPVSVDVTDEENSSDYERSDQDSLVSTLNRIERDLDDLRHYFSNDSEKIDNK